MTQHSFDNQKQPERLSIGIAREQSRLQRDPVCRTCGSTLTFTNVSGVNFINACRCELDIADRQAAIADRKHRSETLRTAYGEWLPPKRYRSTTLADVREPSPGSDDFEGSVAGLKMGRWYLENWPEMMRGGFGMLFHGNSGTAKTMISAAIANELTARGYYVIWVKIKTLYDRLLDQTRKNQILMALERADLLVLDELVGEKDTPAMLREFIRLVDLRYDAESPTIITSNFTDAAIEDHLVTKLTPELGAEKANTVVDAFMSRLLPPQYRRIPFKGPDMRLRLAADWGPDIGEA